MAKKASSKKKTKKKAAKKAPASSRAGSSKTAKKKVAKKPATRKAASKKTAKKKTAAKKTAKKAASKKAAKKKVAKKPAAKKTTAKKSPAKSASKNSPAKKAAAKKPAAKTTPAKKADSKEADSKKVAAKNEKAGDPKAGDSKTSKSGRKGITIVSKKKTSRRKQQSKPVAKFPPTGARLLGPGATPRKPLIPSGPATRDGAADGEEQKRLKKSPLGKRDLKKFRDILIKKRNELFGDVAKLESEALRSESGSLSHTPQHLAEQGSDSYGTSLSLGLADADRRLIKEIDAALERIEAGTYGICELTGRAIRIERLTELPWARYSIDAAREQERGGPRR